MIRALVERLPLMVTPRWVRRPVQPIAAADLVAYLIAAARLDTRENRVYEIAGGEVVSFRELMLRYARARGLRRLMIPVPVVTPALSSWWLRLVTPAHYRIARRIVDGVNHGPVQQDRSSLSDFNVRPVGADAAIHAALEEETRGLRFLTGPTVQLSAANRTSVHRRRAGNLIVERRSRFVEASQEQVFRAIAAVGGATGWYSDPALWRLRAAIDRAAGGVGGRRTARRPGVPHAGDVIDSWTVIDCRPPELLRLRADMRVPGRAWLQLEARASGGGTTLTQTAAFDPRGLMGLLYWWLLYPLHSRVFNGMLAGIEEAALRARAA